MLDKGLVQVYTGDGKGKSTAALGLALRAAGQGNSVLIYQFLKPPMLDLGERAAVDKAGLPIRWEALDMPWDVRRSLGDAQDVDRAKAEIKEALARLGTLAAERACDLLVLDEIVFCVAKGLAEIDDIRRLIEQRDPHVEIVLTGRGATPELIALADLVTEMKNIKHPFDKGTCARPGIDY
jgi:cob(I)alamin adenosyltransferase